MADFTVTITVPDAKVPELREALKGYFGATKIVDGVPVEKTNADLKADFDAEVRRMLAKMYKRYKERQAAVPDLGESA